MFGKRVVVISMLALTLVCVVGVTAEGTGTSPAAGGLSQVGTAFTYQGQILSSGVPVSGTCDFQFSLWDAVGSGTPPTGGNQVGSSRSAPSIPVSNGLFAVQLDFGSGVFTGEARWLQTAVRCPAGSGEYTTLAPRQALNPVPYALFSQDLSLPFDKWTDSAGNAISVGNQGGTGGVANLRIDNPNNAATVINGQTNGTGGAASFWIDNPLNTRMALSAATNGSGQAGTFHTSGLGSAASFRAFNTLNSQPVLNARTDGIGNVATLQIDNPDNTGSLISASTNGLGQGASFSINNPLNTEHALVATTNGSGAAGWFNSSGSHSAIDVWAHGSGSAFFAGTTGTGDVVFLEVDNPDNASNLISAETNGTGQGASFRINNPLNSQPALHAFTSGSGNAGWFRTTGAGDAVGVSTDGSGWAGHFSATGSSGKGVFISTPAGNQGLNVVGGSKNAVVATSEGARLLYTEESSAVWFTDYGFGDLADGSAFITIDPLFAETVNLDEPYHVFVQAYGDAELYVSQRTPDGFEVRSRTGDPEVEFSYRLVATRRGYEGKRLEHAAWADSDPNLYPAQPVAPQNGGAR